MFFREFSEVKYLENFFLFDVLWMTMLSVCKWIWNFILQWFSRINMNSLKWVLIDVYFL